MAHLAVLKVVDLLSGPESTSTIRTLRLSLAAPVARVLAVRGASLAVAAAPNVTTLHGKQQGKGGSVALLVALLVVLFVALLVVPLVILLVALLVVLLVILLVALLVVLLVILVPRSVLVVVGLVVLTAGRGTRESRVAGAAGRCAREGERSRAQRTPCPSRACSPCRQTFPCRQARRCAGSRVSIWRCSRGCTG